MQSQAARDSSRFLRIAARFAPVTAAKPAARLAETAKLRSVRGMETMGKLLAAAGIVLALCGGLVWLMGRHGGALLPGDIVIKGRRAQFYFPVVTCLVLSAVLSLALWLLRR